MRLGVFGGSFDPPHRAHRALAETALAQLQLDRLLIVPTGQAWHKTRNLSPAVHRVAMVQLAFADLPRVQIDTRELDRGGPSYTIDTLRALSSDNPGSALFLIIGQDQAAALSRWHEWREIVDMAMICVAGRADPESDASAFVPPQGVQARFRTLELPISAISATDIRQRVGAGLGIDPLVCAPVARYIVLHRLYQAT